MQEDPVRESKMAKEFSFRGKSIEELQKMSLNDFANLLSSRNKRTIKRGFTDTQKKFLAKLRKTDKKSAVKTHCRDMLILPEMIGRTILVYNGKEFTSVIITEEMIDHRLGEFSLTRKKVQHSAPGIGATRSSASASVK